MTNMIIKFYRGALATYQANPNKYIDGIYFATDSGEIFHGGKSYSGLLSESKSVKDASVANGILTVTYSDDTSAEYSLVDLIPEAIASSETSEGSAGLLSADDKAFIDTLTSEISAGSSLLSSDEAATIASVKAGDYANKVESVSGNILSLNGTNITATVSLSYDTATSQIKLQGKDGANLGTVDATPFIKDGMLTSAELVTDPEGQEAGKYLKLVWNTDSGESEPTYVPLTELVDAYTSGNAISISDNNEINVVVAESTATETNYLVNDGGLKVSGMGAGVTTLSQPIQVVGGPLATELSGVFENNVIPAGTSVEAILMKMICKEIFPTASTSQGSLSTSMSLTQLAFDPTDTTVEVGTIVTTNALTANNSNYSTTAAKIYNLTNGYSLTETGEKATGDITFAVESVTEAANKHKISLTYSGFTETAPSAVEAASTVTMPAQTLVVKEGTCTVSASASGSKYTATSPEVSQTYYNISNVNTRQSETKTISKKNLSSTAAASTSDSVTGVYKYFIGYYDFAETDLVKDVFTSSIIRSLTTYTGNITKDGTTTVLNASTTATSNGKSIVVAVPTKYKLASIEDSFGNPLLSEFKVTGTVAVYHPTNTTYSTDYTVYVFPIAGGTTYKYRNLTIKKA